MEKPPPSTPEPSNIKAQSLRAQAAALRAASEKTLIEEALRSGELRESLSKLNESKQRNAAVQAPNAEWHEAPHPGSKTSLQGRVSIKFGAVGTIEAGGQTIATMVEQPDTFLAEAKSEAPSVPKLGEKILCFVCTMGQLEDALGHLEEEFRRQASRHGMAHARRVYWRRVACFAGSFAGQAARRLLARIALLRALLEKVGWL